MTSELSDQQEAFLLLSARLSKSVEDYKLASISALWTQVKAYESMLKVLEEDRFNRPLRKAEATIKQLKTHREGMLAEAILALGVRG